MKWIENGIQFEGTPEEFRALHPVESGATENPPPKAKIKRPWIRVKAEFAGGGSRYFRAVIHAFRRYQDACPSPEFPTYESFKYALMKTPIQFADATICIVGA